MNNLNNMNGVNNFNYLNNLNNLRNLFNQNSYNPIYNNISNDYYKQNFNLNQYGIINKFNSPTTIDPTKNIPDLPRSLDLEKCFEEFEVEDILSGDNQIYCNNCHRSSDAITKTEIYKAPNVLIIILNRGRGNVFECDVKFGLSLIISKFAKKNDSPKIFDLIGVISHLGESSMEGHFIAFCKHFDGNWHLFNDSIVSNVNEKDIFRGTPYILFYQNRNLI
jgi:ubiquitin C-terminal hydrolase